MRKRNGSILVVAVLALLHAGCGYLMAGTWEDDPGNWKRAFNSTKPDAVVIVHSKYWRSPHWTYEFQYFFELVPTAELKQQLLGKNDLRKLSGEDAIGVRREIDGAPAWFAPKPISEYELWFGTKVGGGHFTVLIDKATGHIFLTDYQL